MLFAVDIDGTIATNGNWFARWMNQEQRLGLPEETLATIQYGLDFWQLPQVQPQRAELRIFAHAHHKDPELQRHSVPIPGAQRALQEFQVAGASIIYTTCRQPGAEQHTSAWLAQHQFPCPDQVSICEHYYEKYVAAYQCARPQEPVVLIDDLADKMIPAFRTLLLQRREIGLSLIRRLTVVAIARTEPPQFAKVPFRVLALPSWRKEDLEQVASFLTTPVVDGVTQRSVPGPYLSHR